MGMEMENAFSIFINRQKKYKKKLTYALNALYVKTVEIYVSKCVCVCVWKGCGSDMGNPLINKGRTALTTLTCKERKRERGRE